MADDDKKQFEVHSYIAGMFHRIEQHLHGVNQASVPGLREDVMRLRRFAAFGNNDKMEGRLERSAFTFKMPDAKKPDAPKPAEDKKN
jgi:hypothetical protein